MILIVHGKDVHFYRLVEGLNSINKEVLLVRSPSEIPNTRFELALVDPSFPYDISKKINADKIAFFDSEDSPTDFYPGEAYYTLKCKTYAKMNYIENDRGDGIKNIGYPLKNFALLGNFARKLPELTQLDTYTPFFVGHPTFLGNYQNYKKLEFKNKNEFRVNVISERFKCYNQRYDWIISLMNASKYKKFNFNAGVVFSNVDNNMALKWQMEEFGNVEPFKVNSLDYFSQLMSILNCGVGLCPTGHERLSWRYLDIMAVGAVMYITDFSDRRTMYMPQEYIKIGDLEDLGSRFLEDWNNMRGLHDLHRKNRDFIKSLTPEKIWNDFYLSIE